MTVDANREAARDLAIARRRLVNAYDFEAGEATFDGAMRAFEYAVRADEAARYAALVEAAAWGAGALEAATASWIGLVIGLVVTQLRAALDALVSEAPRPEEDS